MTLIINRFSILVKNDRLFKWTWIAVGGAGLLIVFWSGLAALSISWSREEYSHGYAIPFIALYLLGRKFPATEGCPRTHVWLGPPMVALAVFLGVIGTISRIDDLSEYGLLIAVVGIFISYLGLRAALMLWVPLVYLVFMVPLPQMIYLMLAAQMQLWSSQLGVLFVHMLGIPVYLEGNVIDLGAYKLQVVEACSGLRYLFPLMSFGFLFAALYRGNLWSKALLFLSTGPITIAMNSFRIGVIGVLVTYFGTEQADGFLHFFEGWVIFLGCVALLFAEAWLLLRLTGPRLRLLEALDLRFDGLAGFSALRRETNGVGPLAVAGAVVLTGVVVLQSVHREPLPASLRQNLAAFPKDMGEWRGQRSYLDTGVAKVLGADDYLMSNYVQGSNGVPVNFFVAFYRNQSNGRVVHSPQVCLPGDGWEITRFKQVSVPVAGSSLMVNRAVIRKGDQTQLVYYWFDQRGRKLVSQYRVKWYIFWDGVTKRRTDGSIVRLVTPIENGAEAQADERLRDFLVPVQSNLPRFLPL